MYETKELRQNLLGLLYYYYVTLLRTSLYITSGVFLRNRMLLTCNLNKIIHNKIFLDEIKEEPTAYSFINFRAVNFCNL